jgi:predicted nucleic acid-binding protein
MARISGVEVVSAIARRRRSGDIVSNDAAAAIGQFYLEFASVYRIIEITSTLVQRAMTLADRHGLRGYDAVQLAAALEVNTRCLALGMPTLTLISADVELNEAAIAEGLIVDNPNVHV